MTTVVYVSNAGSGSISVLTLDAAAGHLQPLQTLALGGTLMPMALHPSGRFLYVADRSAPESVHTLAIDAASGRLMALATSPLPASMANLAIDAAGRWLLAASYGGAVVSVSPIGADGRAGAAQQVLSSGAKSHAIRTDLTNRHAWSTALGDDMVRQWCFDAATGSLTPNEPPALAVRPGAGPRHLELHPNGRCAYLLHELDATLDVLAIEPASGTLHVLQTASALAPGTVGKPWAADLHLAPRAGLLFASERRGSTLAMFAVSADGASVTLLGHSPVQAEPRGFAVAPDERHLVVAGQASHRVGVYAVDAANGSLTLQHEEPVGQGPNWVEILQLPSAPPDTHEETAA